MPEFDLVVKNGMIVDGTLAPRYRDDIGVKNGRIAKIGRIMPHEAAKVIESDGLVVAPGFIDTPWTKAWPEEVKQGAIARTPLKRACTAEDIAEAILFLTAGGAMITGQTLVVDGGLL